MNEESKRNGKEKKMEKKWRSKGRAANSPLC
jgi:hypothetical protein